MPIELGIATPAVPRDPRALDDRFGKWAADLGVTVIGTHLGPTPEDVIAHAAEVRERMAGWGISIVQATGYNPVMVGDDEARRADDLARLTRSFRLTRLLGSPMVLTGCGSHHPTHHYGPHPRNHEPATRARADRPSCDRAMPRAEEHGVVLALECHMLTALDTPAHIREIVDAVGSPNLKVNFDPVNLLNSIDAVFASGAQMEAMLETLLGPPLPLDRPRQGRADRESPRPPLRRDGLRRRHPGLAGLPELRRASGICQAAGKPSWWTHVPAFLASRGLAYLRAQAAARPARHRRPALLTESGSPGPRVAALTGAVAHSSVSRSSSTSGSGKYGSTSSSVPALGDGGNSSRVRRLMA